ncbi:MAG: hypothetical protein ACREUF_04185, partial [Solimonas sp.]
MKTHTTRHPAAMVLAGTAALGLALAFAPVSAGAGLLPPTNCSVSSASLYTACSFDASESLWVTTAQCQNLPDGPGRRACFAEKNATYTEDLALCGAQKRARLEVCEDLGDAPYDPKIIPSNFDNPDDIGGSVAPNPYLLLVPGHTRVYESGDEEITVTITNDTVQILGVTCRVVTDQVILKSSGELVEDTVDWMAQDIFGNVWYFGERVLNYEDGELNNLDGSFKAGVDRAKPGILMKAAPAAGDVYREEWALTEAEDVAEVLSTSASATSPAASCAGT